MRLRTRRCHGGSVQGWPARWAPVAHRHVGLSRPCFEPTGRPTRVPQGIFRYPPHAGGTGARGADPGGMPPRHHSGRAGDVRCVQVLCVRCGQATECMVPVARQSLDFLAGCVTMPERGIGSHRQHLQAPDAGIRARLRRSVFMTYQRVAPLIVIPGYREPTSLLLWRHSHPSRVGAAAGMTR